MRLRKIIFPLVFFVFFVPQVVRAETLDSSIWNSYNEGTKDALLITYINGKVNGMMASRVYASSSLRELEDSKEKNKAAEYMLGLLIFIYEDRAKDLVNINISDVRILIDEIYSTEEYRSISYFYVLNSVIEYSTGLIDEETFKKVLKELAKESKK